MRYLVAVGYLAALMLLCLIAASAALFGVMKK